MQKENINTKLNIKKYVDLVNDRLFDLVNDLKEKGITQNKQAADMGISPASLTKYLKGEDIPNGITIIKMSKYYKVSADYLLGLSTSKSSNIQDRKIADELGLSDKCIKKLKYKTTITENDYEYNYNKVIDFLVDTDIPRIIANYWHFALNDEENEKFNKIKRNRGIAYHFDNNDNSLKITNTKIWVSDDINSFDWFSKLEKRQNESFIKLVELQDSLRYNKDIYLKGLGINDGEHSSTQE